MSERPDVVLTTPSTPPIDLRHIKSTLTELNSPFHSSSLQKFTVHLPTSPYQLGITIDDDPFFNLPFIQQIQPNSPLAHQIPFTFHTNAWIVAIDATEPCFASSALDTLTSYQHADHPTEIELTLCPKLRTTTTDIEETRSQFNQICP